MSVTGNDYPDVQFFMYYDAQFFCTKYDLLSRKTILQILKHLAP
jgi:hypothetical protein